ncbi:hypothetical protein O181_093716 [Austropuccinia psidii MF-1]|uniref:Reverse transcriptase n=1 Tax=Austropuccinia psidii MF-1 TaxID=1389203 RepID=A0A9Q3PBR5_9BASI|nr:hypothetical protein [Austropuccinia psidii MF-1]
MSDSIINMKILREYGEELDHAIKCRFVEPFSTEDYINAMEDIISRTRIGKTWTRVPMESKMVSKPPREDKRPEKPFLKGHKCGSASNLTNTCTKKTKINEVQFIEEVQCTEEKEESDLESAVSEDTPVEDYPIENITAFFEVTEFHTHLPQYSGDFHKLINIQDARMCKTKPARDTSKEEFVDKQLVEAQINPSSSPKIRHDDFDVLYTYKNVCASDNEPLGAIKGNEVDITLNIDRPYPTVLRRPAYPASPRARETLEKHIQELIQLGLIRKVGHNEEVEVTKPVIIACHNDKLRMVGDFRALNTYTAPDRYPIPRI